MCTLRQQTTVAKECVPVRVAGRSPHFDCCRLNFVITMGTYEYEQARSRKDEMTSYDFKRRLDEDDGVGDFWSDVKEDEVQEKKKERTSIVLWRELDFRSPSH
jgi:uncharacterized protein involved in high-affinity Fe2+ transport